MDRGLLITISGPSGVGKDTVAKLVASLIPNCFISISATSRQPRPGEAEGADYYFMTKENFEASIAAGDILEYTNYNGNYYGTPGKKVEEVLSSGKHCILVIEIDGAKKIRNAGREDVSIFILPPKWETLKDRLLKRDSETPEAIAHRIEIAKNEIPCASEYGYIVVNDDADKCAAQIGAIITASMLKSGRQKEILAEVMSDAETINVSDHR